MTMSRISNLKNTQKQGSILSRDSTLDANLDLEEEEGIGMIGNMHRCSMIKKYSMDTFFSPEKMHRRAFTATATENQNSRQMPGSALIVPQGIGAQIQG